MFRNTLRPILKLSMLSFGTFAVNYKKNLLVAKEMRDNSRLSNIPINITPEAGNFNAFQGSTDTKNTVLLFNLNGELHATSGYCGYDMEPLKNGVFYKNRLVCTSCFSEWDVASGMYLRGPNFRNLATFPVNQDSSPSIQVPNREIPLFNPQNKVPTASDRFLIAGDSPLTAGIISEITRTGIGRVTLLSDYSRFKKPLLNSQKMLSSLSRPDLETNKLADLSLVDVKHDKLNTVNKKESIAQLSSGEILGFEHLFVDNISTGNLVPEHSNVSFFRDILDHADLSKKLSSLSNVTVTGDSFEVLRLALALREQSDCQITMLFRKEHEILKTILGVKGMEKLLSLLKEKKIKFLTEDVDFVEQGDKLKILKKGQIQPESHIIFVNQFEEVEPNLFVDTGEGPKKANPVAPENMKDSKIHYYSAYFPMDSYRLSVESKFITGQAIAQLIKGKKTKMPAPVHSVSFGNTRVTLIGDPFQEFSSQIEVCAGEKIINYMFVGEEMKAISFIGCNRLPFYFKEAFETDSLPSLETTKKHGRQLHKRVQYALIKDINV